MSFSDMIDWFTCILAGLTLFYCCRQTFVQLFELKVRILIIEYDIYRQNDRLYAWILRVHRLFSFNKWVFMLTKSGHGSILYDMVEELCNFGDVQSCSSYSNLKVETVLMSLKRLVNFR